MIAHSPNVSIPSPSGLLQNGGSLKSKIGGVSIPSPSGLLQNEDLVKIIAPLGFNPFSFRSPSKRGRLPMWCPSRGFNPFSFRSPSKPQLPGVESGWGFNPFSFRSPSKPEGRTDVLRNGFNPFSFRSPSKRWAYPLANPSPGFNPFSFRSPSKPYGTQTQTGQQQFQSLLLQVSFKTCYGRTAAIKTSFQSLLLQVSFKTMSRSTLHGPISFNPFSFRSPSKPTAVRENGQIVVSIPSPSGLLQNGVRVYYSQVVGFNPFSFRSPSKRKGAMIQSSIVFVSIPSPSGLLQNIHVTKPHPSLVFQSLLLQVSFKTLAQAAARLGRVGFNPFSFRSPSKRSTLLAQAAARLFQSLLLQVSFKTHVEINLARTNCFNPFSFRSPSKLSS